jgi:hypothetical protein
VCPDLGVCVSVVGNVHIVVGAGRRDLLVLGGQEHGGNAQQLQFVAADGNKRQIAVDVVDGEAQRLRPQPILHGYLHQPVHEDAPHVVVEVALH